MMTEEYYAFLEQKVEKGVKDYEDGLVYSHEEVWEIVTKTIIQTENEIKNAA